MPETLSGKSARIRAGPGKEAPRGCQLVLVRQRLIHESAAPMTGWLVGELVGARTWRHFPMRPRLWGRDGHAALGCPCFVPSPNPRALLGLAQGAYLQGGDTASHLPRTGAMASNKGMGIPTPITRGHRILSLHQTVSWRRRSCVL